jgi:uncharacterized cupin superfamily protein
VLEGRPTLRDPDGEAELESGDVVCFPRAGRCTPGLQQKRRPRALFVSTKGDPSAAVYPDSEKIGLWPGDDRDKIMVRRTSSVDYWDGESRR